jgi:hypothetical protein
MTFVPDAADEIIERLAREFVAHGLGEITYMETLQIPTRMGKHLVVSAMHRAAMKLAQPLKEIAPKPLEDQE